jgi:hypothetical protein
MRVIGLWKIACRGRLLPFPSCGAWASTSVLVSAKYHLELEMAFSKKRKENVQATLKMVKWLSG